MKRMSKVFKSLERNMLDAWERYCYGVLRVRLYK